MNPKFEFIKYEPTPQEKHLGIATVKLYGKIIARYKIVPTKDGTSFFPAAASYKEGDRYESCLILDSNSEKEELDAMIKANVRAYQGGAKVAMTGNAFSDDYRPSPPTQPKYEQTSFIQECPF